MSVIPSYPIALASIVTMADGCVVGCCSYEPPYFAAADPNRKQWYFSTHSDREKPERYTLGSLETGHQK